MKLSQPQEQTNQTIEPGDRFVEWQFVDNIGNIIILGFEIILLSSIVILWNNVKPFLEAQRAKLMNSDRDKIYKLIDELAITADADRVLVCEFINQRTAAGGDAPKVLCTYETTRNSTQRVGFDINETTCSGSILSSFNKNKFVKRIVKEIENDRYRSFLQYLNVYTCISYPIELDDQIFGFISIHHVRDDSWSEVVTEQLVKSFASQIAFLLRG